MISCFILSKQSKVKIIFMTGISDMAIGLSNIDFTANNRLYSCFFGCQVEINNAIHCTMISYGKAIHAQFLSLGDKLRNATHAIEETVLSVNMKMDKVPRHHLDYSNVVA